MKKAKFLALVMVFAIMLMGVGYAAWTDKVTLNTTVSTGVFDVDFTSVSAKALNEADIFNIPSQIKNLQSNLDCHAVDHKTKSDRIIVTAGNLYPGASFQVDAKVTNTGTIPAILNNVTASAAGDASLLDLLEVTVIYDEGPGATSNFEIYSGSVNGLNEVLFPSILLDLGITPIENNDTDSIIFIFEFPYDTPEQYLDSEGYFEGLTQEFNIDFDWIQFNASFEAAY